MTPAVESVDGAAGLSLRPAGPVGRTAASGQSAALWRRHALVDRTEKDDPGGYR
jgi:hypothetical protein